MFWLMLIFGVLSSLCVWALQALPLTSLGRGLVGALGLVNAGLSTFLTWRLMRD
ncbi:MAG: hypothetical protein KatS3mg122_3135 [Caldimonas sp.]|nr:MAG: hypothetical protein KatS3mg122_3135 [Caldimonas sp.]